MYVIKKLICNCNRRYVQEEIAMDQFDPSFNEFKKIFKVFEVCLRCYKDKFEVKVFTRVFLLKLSPLYTHINLQILERDPAEDNLENKKESSGIKKITPKDPMKDGESDDSDEVTDIS